MGNRMHKGLAAVAVGSCAAVVVALTLSTNSTAATTGVDLGITGSTVAGVVLGQVGQKLAFSFTVKNHSTTTSASLGITFTVARGTANGTDFICPMISNHFDINPDEPTCEPGTLRHGRSTRAAIVVTPTSTGTLTVKACAENQGDTDPVSSNNCKTISVPIG